MKLKRRWLPHLDVAGQVTELSHSLWGEKRVSYSFTSHGVVFSGSASASKPIWRRLRVTSALPIRFVPSNPAINHPAAWEEHVLPDWALFFLPALSAASCVGLSLQMHRRRQLIAEGLPTAGVVTKRLGYIEGLCVAAYQFRTLDGRVARGKAKVPPDTGTVVCVLYLPQNPRRNLSYPCPWFRVAR